MVRLGLEALLGYRRAPVFGRARCIVLDSEEHLFSMTQKEIAMFREIVEMHPSFSQEQERIDDVIAFFYNLIRDQPELLAKADRALQERYGFTITGETVNKRS